MRMLPAKFMLVNKVDDDLPLWEETQERKNNKKWKRMGKGLSSDRKYKVLWKHTERAFKQTEDLGKKGM